MNKILFYSSKCKNCINLLNYINKNKQISEYETISVDDNSKYNYIKELPTLVIRDIKKSFSGKDAYIWIKNDHQKKSYNIKPNKKDKINQLFLNYNNSKTKKYIKNDNTISKKITDYFFNK